MEPQPEEVQEEAAEGAEQGPQHEEVQEEAAPQPVEIREAAEGVEQGQQPEQELQPAGDVQGPEALLQQQAHIQVCAIYCRHHILKGGY